MLRPVLRSLEISARIVWGCQASAPSKVEILAPDLRDTSLMRRARLLMGLVMSVSDMQVGGSACLY